MPSSLPATPTIRKQWPIGSASLLTSCARLSSSGPISTACKPHRCRNKRFTPNEAVSMPPKTAALLGPSRLRPKSVWGGSLSGLWNFRCCGIPLEWISGMGLWETVMTCTFSDGDLTFSLLSLMASLLAVISWIQRTRRARGRRLIWHHIIRYLYCSLVDGLCGSKYL